MEKRMLMLAVALVATGAVARDVELGCDSKYDFRFAGQDQRCCVFEEKSGRTGGGAFRLTCPEDRKNALFHGTMLTKVESVVNPVRVRAWVKGAGKGSIGILFYDSKTLCLYPPKGSSPFTVGPGEGWKEIAFDFVPVAGSEYCNRVATVNPRIDIAAGSEILVDDISLKFADMPAGIRIEEAPAETRTLDLAGVRNPVFTAHVNGKPAQAPEGAGCKVTEAGIELSCVFSSPGHDAGMAEFPLNEGAFSEVTLDRTIADCKQGVFIVLTDRNGEKHYFGFPAGGNGRHSVTAKVKVRNEHPGEHFAWRWGGDDNQTLDFPVKSVMLGVNDRPDAFTGEVKAVFHKLSFK